jgi:hypothetical protein
MQKRCPKDAKGNLCASHGVVLLLGTMIAASCDVQCNAVLCLTAGSHNAAGGSPHNIISALLLSR